jgi:transcriptional regulator with XRE-family HTH domain
MGAVIRAYRAHPFHGTDIPQEIVANWGNISQSRLSHIENGEEIDSLKKLSHWAQILRIPPELLWFRTPNTSVHSNGISTAAQPDERGAEKLEPRVDYAEQGRTLLLPPSQAPDDPVAENSRLITDSAMVDLLALAWMMGRLDQRMGRREVLQMAATLAIIPALGVADPIERIRHALTRPTGLTEDMVEHLEARSIGFHRLEFVLPARQIFRGLLVHLNDITTLLEVCTQDKLHARLARTAGETAVLGAWLAWELGEAQRAASLYHIAELAARESGDPAILACSAIYQSFELAEAGAHLTAQRRLADARQALPQHSDLATRAWLLGREAEEIAAMGDPVARDMIEKASNMLMQARPVHERPWTRCLESPQLTHMRLTIATRLADRTSVYQYVGDLTALATDPTQKKTGRVLASIGLALITIGDLHEGIQAGQRSLESIKISQARYALDRLTDLSAALTGASPQERDLREGIRATRQRLLSPRPPTPGRS